MGHGAGGMVGKGRGAEGMDEGRIGTKVWSRGEGGGGEG